MKIGLAVHGSFSGDRTPFYYGAGKILLKITAPEINNTASLSLSRSSCVAISFPSENGSPESRTLLSG
jgi:hypothetical protein